MRRVPETRRCVKSRMLSGALLEVVGAQEHLLGRGARTRRSRRASGAPAPEPCAARPSALPEMAAQVRHLDRGFGGLDPLVGPAPRLLHRVAGQHAEADRVSRLGGERGQRRSHRVPEDLVVRRLPADDRRERDDGVGLAPRRTARGPRPGTSKAPGTRATTTSAARAPRRRSVSSAAASMASVTVGFQRAQTTPNRRPSASRLPSNCFGEKDTATRRGTRMLKDRPSVGRRKCSRLRRPGSAGDEPNSRSSSGASPKLRRKRATNSAGV